MHLLLAQKGTISDGEEAIDLGQSPADILFLSAADTELSAIAAAHRIRQGKSSLRVASLLTLKHPMSVDTYVERTARHARLIIVRPLGGASYFQYVLEALHAAAITQKFQIAVLPGHDKPDPGLEPFSTVAADDRNRMWAYFTEGGADNPKWQGKCEVGGAGNPLVAEEAPPTATAAAPPRSPPHSTPGSAAMPSSLACTARSAARRRPRRAGRPAATGADPGPSGV